MKGYKWFSELVSLLGNISSVASCILAAVGVTNIVYLTNETKEIVKEIKVEKEIKKEYIHDTIFIEKPNSIERATSIISSPPKKTTKINDEENFVSNEEKKEIEKKERDFREKHGLESSIDQYRF